MQGDVQSLEARAGNVTVQDHTAESIKSLEGFKRAWIEEAQTISSRSLSLLRPTIRAEGSENRIEAGRRLFPSMWFNEETTRGGIEALGAYHAKKDEDRQIDLGPEHDWSSHAADAFGLGCVVYEEPRTTTFTRKLNPGRQGNWMGA